LRSLPVERFDMSQWSRTRVKHRLPHRFRCQPLQRAVQPGAGAGGSSRHTHRRGARYRSVIAAMQDGIALVGILFSISTVFFWTFRLALATGSRTESTYLTHFSRTGPIHQRFLL
jgi:hypothetical protein